MRVDYGGFNYTGIPQIRFLDDAEEPISNPPLASGIMVSGGVSGATILSSGNEKYFNNPPVSWSGGSAVRDASGVLLTDYPYETNEVPFIGIAMLSGGSGYTGLPTVHLTYTSDPPHVVNRQASGTAILGSGFITGLEITDPGNNYQRQPTLEQYAFEQGSSKTATNYFFVGPDFTEPSFNVHTGSGRLIQLNLTSGGLGVYRSTHYYC